MARARWPSLEPACQLPPCDWGKTAIKAKVFSRLRIAAAKAPLTGGTAVGARRAGAVQEQDRRVRLLGLVVVRDEDDILRVGTVGRLVHPVEKSRRPPVAPRAADLGRTKQPEQGQGPDPLRDHPLRPPALSQSVATPTSWSIARFNS